MIKRLSLAGAILIAIYYLWIFFNNLVNVPNSDDFELLSFVSKFSATSDWQERFSLIFSKHNEHIIASSRLAALLSLRILGELNFSLLILLGNVALFATIYLISVEQRELIPISFFISCALLLQPQHAQATLWATSSLAMLLSCCFSVASFRFTQHESRFSSFFCYSFCLLALFSQANGLFALLICGIIFYTQKKRLASAIFLLSFAAFLTALYAGELNKTTGGDLSDQIFALLTFLGSALSFENKTLALVSGVVLITIAVLLNGKKSCSTTPILWGTVVFCIVTALASSLSRSHLDLDLGFSTSRYRFISALFVAVLLIQLSTRKWLQLPAAIFAAIFFFSSQVYYHHYPLTFSQLARDSILRWQIAADGLLHSNRQYSNLILNEAITNGFYTPPTVDPVTVHSKPVSIALPNYSRTIEKGFDHLLQDQQYLLFDGWAAVPNVDTNTPKTFLVLKSDANHYTFTMTPRFRPDVTQHFKQGNYDQSGFIALVPKSSIAKGRYLRGILIEQDGSSTLRYFTPEIEIE